MLGFTTESRTYMQGLDKLSNPYFKDVDDLLEKAMLLDEVEEVPVQETFGHVIEGYKAIKVGENVTDIVKNGFQPVTNRKLAETVWDYLEKDTITLTGGGRSDDGEFTFFEGRINGTHEISRGDEIAQYLFFGGTHSTKMSHIILPKMKRLICMNEKGSIMRDTFKHTIRHSGNIDRKLLEITAQLTDNVAETVNKMREMTKVTLSKEDAVKYVLNVTEAVISPTMVENKQLPKAIDAIMMLSETGLGSELPGVKGSLWGYYNAITEYYTHLYGKSADTRSYSLINGKANLNITRAFNQAEDILKVA